MLSFKRSRNRIPVALVASCLLFATQPATICPIICLTRAARMLYGDGGGEMSDMAPCHTGYGVTAGRVYADLSLVALPASGRLVLTGGARPSPMPEPAAIPAPVFPENRTPPPRIG